MFCAECGQRLDEGYRYCPRCGTRVATLDQRRAPERVREFAAELFVRVRNILLSPATEWTVIAAESSSARGIYGGYVAPMVALAVIATFLGETLVGVPGPFPGTIRLSAAAALGHAVLSLALSVLGVFLITLIVDALAPSFGGRPDRLAALKVTAYSYTPAWVASLLHLIPLLGLLVIIAAFYGLYVLYLGLPVLMGSSKDQAVGYTVVTVLCAIVIWIVSGWMSSLVVAALDAGG